MHDRLKKHDDLTHVVAVLTGKLVPKSGLFLQRWTMALKYCDNCVTATAVWTRFWHLESLQIPEMLWKLQVIELKKTSPFTVLFVLIFTTQGQESQCNEIQYWCFVIVAFDLQKTSYKTAYWMYKRAQIE